VATGYAMQHIPVPVQARANWEGCGRKGIQQNLGDDGMEALETQMSWHPVGSPVQVYSFAPVKSRK